MNTEKMKTVGLVGGIAWSSSAYYYKAMNMGINKLKGDFHFSRSIMYSLNLHEYATQLYKDDKTDFKQLVAEAALCVFKGGADFLIICSNTAHMAINEIEAICKLSKEKTNFISKELSILHISDCTAYSIRKNYPSMKKIGLIGTLFTMQSPHIVDRFELHGFTVKVPKKTEDHRKIMDIIENELTKEIFKETSYNYLLEVIYKLEEEEQIEGIVLGCTEIPLLIKDSVLKTGLKVFDATEMHIECGIQVQLNIAKMEDFLPK